WPESHTRLANSAAIPDRCMGMKRSLVIVSMLGCGSAPHAPEHIANTKPPMKRPVVALTDDWPAAGAGDLVAMTPAGPYPSLSAVCVALDSKESEDKFEGCHTQENDELGGGP